MSQLINFDKYRQPKTNRKGLAMASSCVDSELLQPIVIAEDTFHITLDVLVKNNPNKTMFSIKEVAEQLNIGNEFIRRRIKSGKIKVTYLGDKPFINIVELARIITEGV